ncbi:transcriptional corepressor LEUNIG-like [Forsythia ovata]|uniref:Transcriptional corepressor LEUNIG-like n=1 Tax=Forsythia ovata TaxID=205694 RepID=A0ABD1QCT5_9LAMI
MVRNNMHTTAEIFAKEAEVNPKAVANNLPEEFLTDWWSLFWDVYCARGEDARRPEAPEASSSKDTQTTENVPTNINPTTPRPDFSQMMHQYFNERSKVIKPIPSQGLPLTQECATIGAHLQPDFKPNLAVQTSGELILSALGNSTNAANPILIDDSLNWKHLQRGKNVVEEEPLDVDNFFNDNPYDMSILPCSSPVRDKTQHKGFSFEEVKSLQTKTKLRCCHFSTSGKLLAAAGHERTVDTVLIWNIESLSTNIIKAHSHLISDIRFKPNSTVFATSSFDRSVQVWDAVKPTKSNSRLVGHVEPVMSLDFHPTKANILCSCDSNDEIRLWNVNESACIRAFKGANRQVRFQPRSGNLLAAATGNVINMIDVETGTIHYRLEGHAKDVRSMCWDISGRYMASVSEDCARIWSIVAGGKSVHHLQSIENKFVSCTFHPVYSLVLAIGSYQSLEIWNPMNGIKMWTHRAHEGIVSGLTHTFATHKIASVSQDSWMKVWK